MFKAEKSRIMACYLILSIENSADFGLIMLKHPIFYKSLNERFRNQFPIFLRLPFFYIDLKGGQLIDHWKFIDNLV